jgi:adenylate cyclase
VCDKFARNYQGGAEVPLTMLFADIRGSTTLAEKMAPREYSKLINRFYVKSTQVLTSPGAFLEKLAGDEVTAIFSNGIVGVDYTRVAVATAKDLLRVTGHANPNGPWVSIGIGIHTGTAFIGSVGLPSGVMEVTTLGDVPNVASRITGLAQPGEILISEETLTAARQDPAGLEKRELSVKGREEKITVYAIHL